MGLTATGRLAVVTNYRQPSKDDKAAPSRGEIVPLWLRGVLYRAANFRLMRTNERGLQTYMRPLRGLQPHEHRLIHRASDHDERARYHRARRMQPALLTI